MKKFLSEDDVSEPIEKPELYSLCDDRGIALEDDKELADAIGEEYGDGDIIPGIRAVACCDDSDDNSIRRYRAQTAIAAYLRTFEDDMQDEDTRSVLRDLLSDLRHYCDETGDDFNKALLTSEINFEEEQDDD